MTQKNPIELYTRDSLINYINSLPNDIMYFCMDLVNGQNHKETKDEAFKNAESLVTISDDYYDYSSLNLYNKVFSKLEDIDIAQFRTIVMMNESK